MDTEKLEKAVAELKEKGVHYGTSAPYHFILYRYCKVNIRPPYYAHFMSAFFGGSIPFCIGMFVLYVVMDNLTPLIILTVIGGAFFLGLYAIYDRNRLRKKYNLSDWDDL